MTRRAIWKSVLSLIFSAFMFLLIFWLVDFNIIDLGSYSVNWFIFGISSSLFFLNYALRAVRFRVLMVGDFSSAMLFSVSLLHGALNYLFPFKTGEFSFPVMSKIFLRRPLSESALALIICRIMDLILIAVLMLGVFFFDNSLVASVVRVFENVSRTGFYFVVSVMAITIFSFLVFFRVFRIGCLLSKYFARFRNISCLQIILIFMLTFLIWFCMLANFYFLSISMGYQIPFVTVALVSILMTPLSMFPVQGVANVGMFELAWVTVLTLLGWSKDYAFQLAIKVHVLLTVQVFMMILIGAIIIIMLKWSVKHAR